MVLLKDFISIALIVLSPILFMILFVWMMYRVLKALSRNQPKEDGKEKEDKNGSECH